MAKVATALCLAVMMNTKKYGPDLHKIWYMVEESGFRPVPTSSGTLLSCFELEDMSAFRRIHLEGTMCLYTS